MIRQIFLSISGGDRKMAAGVERELKKLGVTSINPASDSRPGAETRKSIMNAIRRADSVIVLVTEPYAPASGWTGYEIGVASALGKQVLVAKPPSISARDLPTDLSSWRTVDFDPSSARKTAETLVSSLAMAA